MEGGLEGFMDGYRRFTLIWNNNLHSLLQKSRSARARQKEMVVARLLVVATASSRDPGT